MKCTKNQRPRIRRCNLTWEDRKRIAKVWNVPDGHKHLSIREAAKILHIPESSLRYELKRGCADGQVCMKLRDKRKSATNTSPTARTLLRKTPFIAVLKKVPARR